MTSDSVITTVLKAGLPVLCIETIGHEEPTCDYVSAPEGCWGKSIMNATKVPGRIQLIDSTGILYDSGNYMKDDSGMTIRIRGNTSAYHPKKPYKIKLQRKADLLLRDEDRYRDKEWVLLQDLRLNMLEGNTVSWLMGMDYTPASMHVNVVFNGEYQGLYVLSETVKRNKDCRINVDAESGFIAELDAYWWKEDDHIECSFDQWPLEYTFEYPDADEITPEQKERMAQCLTDMEQSMRDGSYPSHIDVESFARWLLAQEVLGNADAGGSNVFVCKYDSADSSFVFMPVLWDFDNIRREKSWSDIHNIHYFVTLLDSPNEAFRDAYIRMWEERGDSVFDGLISAIRQFESSPEGAAFDRSLLLDRERWQYNYIEPLTLHEIATAAIDYFTHRREWINDAIKWMKVTISIHDIPEERTDKSDSRILDLSGRILSTMPSHGISIVNGKKYMRKK